MPSGQRVGDVGCHGLTGRERERVGRCALGDDADDPGSKPKGVARRDHPADPGSQPDGHVDGVEIGRRASSSSP